MLLNFVRQTQPRTKNIMHIKSNCHRYDRSSIDNIRLCDKKPCDNIDSHDNSLYHESLTEINNYNYSIKSIVDDYNRRWDEDITIEQYLKKFTRKHRGGC